MNMQWVPYLVMDGNAGETADFYAQALGRQVVNRMTFGDDSYRRSRPLVPGAGLRFFRRFLAAFEHFDSF